MKNKSKLAKFCSFVMRKNLRIFKSCFSTSLFFCLLACLLVWSRGSSCAGRSIIMRIYLRICAFVIISRRPGWEGSVVSLSSVCEHCPDVQGRRQPRVRPPAVRRGEPGHVPTGQHLDRVPDRAGRGKEKKRVSDPTNVGATGARTQKTVGDGNTYRNLQ